MVASMYIIVIEYCFTQGKYNYIMVMLVYMDSELVIDTVQLSTNNNHDEYPPTLTEAVNV